MKRALKMLQEEALYKSASPRKGDEIQKLNFIQTLPSLLATDSESCMTRVIPKVQQSLATASTEFHIAASSTFKTILEQNLVNHNVFSRTFLQSILNSLEKRDPVICHAWLETLLDVIELLPVEVIRRQILPMTVSKGQLSQPIYSRIICSKILGKICTRFDSALIQKEVLPMVHSLCQDVNSEVRASICLQLRFVAEGLGAESVKSALLPSLVELASDEESNVRCASVQTIAYLLPHLQEDTIKTTIVPLVRKLCESTQSAQPDDNVICVIAEEYGKIVLGIEKCLLPTEKLWFLKYFQQLAQMGIVSMRKESKPHLPFVNSNPDEDGKYVECRRCCAFNLPAMFIFVSSSADDTEELLVTFAALASDHYYMVRRTVACGIHEIAKILGPKCGRMKAELIKLLKDNSEEVLQGLVPHIALTLDCLADSQTIGVDRMDSTVMEIGRALLKCESEIAATHNWRLTSLMHSQLEILPKYFPSDFIYSYFVPMTFFRILHARPIPVRLSAGTLFLFLLRYNMKPMQRIELRSKLYSELANNPNCYVRMMFVRMMIEAMEIFSSVYFKEHFLTVLLNLAEDPVPNIRMKVVSLLPQLKSLLRIPGDKKLLTALESTVAHVINSEKDRDVLAQLTIAIKQLDAIRHENRVPSGALTRTDLEDSRKLDEENKLSGMSSGKSPGGGGIIKKGASGPARAGGSAGGSGGGVRRTTTDTSTRSMHHTVSRDSLSGSPRRSADSTRTSSMPEIPVMLPDDEFLVDAGIRIPDQLSQSTSKIPHLQDPMFGKRRTAFNVNRVRPASMNFDKGKPKRNSSMEYEDCMKRRTNGDQSNNIRTSMEYEDGIKRRTNGANQTKHIRLRSIDYEDGSSLVKKNKQQLDDIESLYMEHRIRANFGFCPNQDKLYEERIKQENSLTLAKKKRKVVQSKSIESLYMQHMIKANFESCPNQDRLYEERIKQENSLILANEKRKVVKSKSIESLYMQHMIRTRFGFCPNQDKLYEERIKQENSLTLAKKKRKVVQSKSIESLYMQHLIKANFGSCPNQDRLYEERIKQENSLTLAKKKRKVVESKSIESLYMQHMIKANFESCPNQDRLYEERIKQENSLTLANEKRKVVQSKCMLDRTKRYSANFSLKMLDTKEAKPVLKEQRSIDVADYTPSERPSRALRRYSTLDVNHNQGHSKIPLRSFIHRSRTAPATRASSPVSSQIRYEEIDKLCRKLEGYELL